MSHRRKCGPEEWKESPTLCSNYRYIEYLERKINTLEDKLSDKISRVMEDIEQMKKESEMRVTDTETQLERHDVDIGRLQTAVGELAKHRKILGGNFSQIEKKLDDTERQLSEKRVKLENFETETAKAFSDTRRLLNLYKTELSSLNDTAQELQGKVQERLLSTTQLETKLQKVENNTEAFHAKLNAHKAGVDQAMAATDRSLRNADEQLKAQQITADQQTAAIVTLKSDTAAIKNRLWSNEGKVADLRQDVNGIKAGNVKVAFSATVIESAGVFTGPAITRNLLIFNKVFANVGNAYNSKTGIFTAPVKGVYHFSFMTFGYSSHTSGAILVKNGVLQVSTYEFKGPDASDTTSNTVILELNVGETVNIILWRNGKVNTSVFSGFLIFPTE